jgi:hypothetical protein
MSDSTQNEFNFFQFDPHQIGQDWKPAGAQHRAPAMKMSNFGALFYGGRMSADYTRTELDYQDKTDLENPELDPFTQDAEYEDNPFVADSSVKRTKDDQMFKMGMSNERGTQINYPGHDVSDTDVVVGTMTAGKNYPTEGWRSFGGKYDFPVAYDGTL